MEKLKMGDEIYVYLEGGHEYLSYESENGYEDQTFNSSEYPTKVKAAYLWNEEDYEVYAFMEIPDELRFFFTFAEKGFKNLEKESNKIIEATIKGKAEDGREILHPRSINIEDVNKIAGVKPDFEKGIVYLEKKSDININLCDHLGYSRKIQPREEKWIEPKFINKEGEAISTAYKYYIGNPNIPEYKKRILDTDGIHSYLLASRSVHVSFGPAYFCVGRIDNGFVDMSYRLFSSDGDRKYFIDAIRPIFYLKSKKYEREENLESEKESNDDVRKKVVKPQENLEETCKNKENSVMAKLKMGDIIDVYLEGGHEYLSYESENGYRDQIFSSSECRVEAAYLWDEEDENGNTYEAYTFMKIPDYLKVFYVYGQIGLGSFLEEIREIVSKTVKGKTGDGRTILNPKSMNIGIAKKIGANFRTYKEEKLNIPEYKKKILDIGITYYLADKDFGMHAGYVTIYEDGIYIRYVRVYSIYSDDCFKDSCANYAVRPVFYLKPKR